MRAIAALAVLFFHEKYLSIGYGGVDIFFVISGFIIGTVGMREHPASFAKKRLIRIVPLYWTVTLLMCALSWVPGALSRFTFDLKSLAKSLLFIPYFDASGQIWPLIVPGWTLNFEMLFYMVFAVCLSVGLPRLVFALIAGTVTAGLILNPSGAALQTYTSPLLLEFAAGLVLAEMPFLRQRRLGLLMLVAVALFVFTAFSRVTEDQPLTDRLLWLGLPAVLLVAGALALERSGHWPVMPLLESVGDASFSLYLLHGIVFAIAHKFLTLPPAAVTMIAIVLSIGVALLSYRFFERPVARWLHQHMVFPKSRPKLWPKSWPKIWPQIWRDPAKKLIGTPDPER